MKTALLLLLVAFTSLAADSDSRRKPGAKPDADSAKAPETLSSLDKPSARHASLQPGLLKFEDADVLMVLQYYQDLSGRTVVRPSTLPSAKITLQSARPISALKALQMLDTVLAQNGIVMIPQGSDIVKAVPAAAAAVEAVPICELSAEELPESQSYTCYIVRLKERRPRDVAQMLQPFAKLPNSILSIDDGGLLVLRDYAVNVKRMLHVIERLEQEPPRKFEDDKRRPSLPGLPPLQPPPPAFLP